MLLEAFLRIQSLASVSVETNPVICVETEHLHYRHKAII